MKKSQIVNSLDYRATTVFVAATVALTASAALNFLFGSSERFSQGFETVVNFIAIIFSYFAYALTVRGFGFVDKASRLSEENENFFMGRNLKILSVLSIVLTTLILGVQLVFSMFLKVYQTAESLTVNDERARTNLIILMSIVNIAFHLVSISVVYIIYLWRLHKLTSKSDSLNNFALLTMLILVIHIAVAILNLAYILLGKQSDFLADFSNTMHVIKYLVLTLFFITRRKLAFKDESDSGEGKKSGGEAPQTP